MRIGARAEYEVVDQMKPRRYNSAQRNCEGSSHIELNSESLQAEQQWTAHNRS